MQAELLFQELWRINEDGLPIALHHGSLDVGQRRKVEAAMAAGQLARRRLHLDARSRHRLGRRRPRRPCRRAQGREPARCSASAAPTTAWTSRRRRSWSRPTASRCWNARPRSTPTMSARRTRRRCRASARLDVLAQHVLGMACADALRCRRALRRGRPRPRPMRDLDLRRLRARRRFRRHRRLCAAEPTSASPRSAQGRTGSGASPTRASPSNTG